MTRFQIFTRLFENGIEGYKRTFLYWFAVVFMISIAVFASTTGTPFPIAMLPIFGAGILVGSEQTRERLKEKLHQVETMIGELHVLQGQIKDEQTTSHQILESALDTTGSTPESV